MSVKIHTSNTGIPKNLPLSYFKEGYFQSQVYNHFIGYSNNDFFIPFDITQDLAISIPRSPFGSIIRRKKDSNELQTFIDGIIADLKKRKVNTVEIHHPSEIYDLFPAKKNLEQNGFRIKFNDVNQHIVLAADWEDSIHTMQKRKLQSLISEGFTFRKMGEDEFETAHKFLTVCRQAQGLQINIEWPHLKKLMDQLPGIYECFGVFREEKISALCITVKVTDDTAYYYLPATSPMFRDKSPMVLLIAGMVKYFRDNEFKYFDLGVSSFEGKVQEPLRIFKERMGAKGSVKPTFLKSL